MLDDVGSTVIILLDWMSLLVIFMIKMETAMTMMMINKNEYSDKVNEKEMMIKLFLWWNEKENSVFGEKIQCSIYMFCVIYYYFWCHLWVVGRYLVTL